MKVTPTYPKILALGSTFTENALVGDVIVQEKVDGSQFRFGVNEDGEIVIASKGQTGLEHLMPAMFLKGIEYIESIAGGLKSFPKDTYFYGEYLEKPKHNVLKYDRTPNNHIVLFDAWTEGHYVDRETLSQMANFLGIDLIPELYKGKADVEKVKELLTTESYLGNEVIEGVVIKNYNQTILLGGQVFPLFTKYVREAFKERHQVEWKIQSPKASLADFVEGFRTKARWHKAIQYLRDKGELTNSPKDIGLLIKRVQQDILEEETENIKNELYKKFIGDITRKSVNGLPEFYKNELLNNLNNE